MATPVPLPPELDRQLQSHFDRTMDHFGKLGSKAPEAIVLGGGYGRGEGGIATGEDGEPSFFNDLDYFIFTERPEDPELVQALHSWERDETEVLGIDVEGKLLPKSDLKQTPGSMMFYDLVAAQTIVSGPKDYFAPYLSLARPETIEGIEATRLLWNRGSGLLFALNDLGEGRDFSVVHRNQAKAKLALGDALLTIRGKYRAYVRERHEVLEAEEGIDARIAALHAEGVAFKLRPTAHPSVEQLEAAQAELTDLWLRSFLEVESKRLNQNFRTPSDYAAFAGKLFPETARVKNMLLALRDRLKRGGGVRPIWDYPRGALQRSLVLLLESEPDFSKISEILGASISNLEEAVHHYTKWWGFYS